MDVVYYSQVINEKTLSQEEIGFFLSSKAYTYYVSSVFRNVAHLSDTISEYKTKGYKAVFIRDDFFPNHYLMYFFTEEDLISKIKRSFKLKEFL